MQAFFLVLVVGISLGQSYAKHNPMPKISAIELLHLEDIPHELSHAVSHLGAFVLDDLGGEVYHAALEDLAKSAPSCFEQHLGGDVKAALLDDGVRRLTSATASVLDKKHPDCVDVEIVEKVLDLAEKVVHKVIAAMNGGEDFTFYDAGGKLTKLSEAPHLDHIHIYQKPEYDEESELGLFTVPYHRDNGILLLITPTPEHPLLVRDVHGYEFEASNGDVAVLFGRAMEEWLLQGKEGITERQRFRAAPHAVPSLRMSENLKEDRVVFARMLVASEDAVPKIQKAMKTFGDVFHNTGSSSQDQCTAYKSLFRDAQDEQCPDGFQFCWHTCLELPDPCEFGDPICINDVGDCCGLDDSWEGHDGSCQWQCTDNCNVAL